MISTIKNYVLHLGSVLGSQHSAPIFHSVRRQPFTGTILIPRPNYLTHFGTHGTSPRPPRGVAAPSPCAHHGVPAHSHTALVGNNSPNGSKGTCSVDTMHYHFPGGHGDSHLRPPRRDHLEDTPSPLSGSWSPLVPSDFSDIPVSSAERSLVREARAGFWFGSLLSK